MSLAAKRDVLQKDSEEDAPMLQGSEPIPYVIPEEEKRIRKTMSPKTKRQILFFIGLVAFVALIVLLGQVYFGTYTTGMML